MHGENRLHQCQHCYRRPCTPVFFCLFVPSFVRSFVCLFVCLDNHSLVDISRAMRDGSLSRMRTRLSADRISLHGMCIGDGEAA